VPLDSPIPRRAALALLASGALAGGWVGQGPMAPARAWAAEPTATTLPDKVPVHKPDGSTEEIGLDDYLRGVVPSEMRAAWPMEALKAQAVAARTYAAAYYATRGAICTTTSCQMWDPSRRSARTDAAVEATARQVLVHADTFAWAYYSSTCGGQTESAAGRAGRYCRSVRCWLELDGSGRDPLPLGDEVAAVRFWGEPRPEPSFCGPSPHFRHVVAVDRADAEAVVDRYLPAVAAAPRYEAGALGRLTDLAVVARGASGRATRLRVAGRESAWELAGETALRSLLRPSADGAAARSTAVAVGVQWDAEGVSRLTVRGGGYGHGVGLCQHGAKGMAERGYDYRAILGHYYSAVEIATL
jgi:stage II sporulation protein D